MQQASRPEVISISILICLMNSFIPYCSCQNDVYRWGSWSSYPLLCSVTCGTGIKCKVRNCLDDHGNVQEFVDLCRDSEQPGSEAQLCTSCSMEARCPHLPGWSSWNSWSSCTPIEKKEIKDFSKCQAGYRIRFRSCDNPPPDPPPVGIPCSGPNQAITNCVYNCEDSNDATTQRLGSKIQHQINRDFQAHLHLFNQVIRTKVKNFIQLGCETFAYDTAKTLISQSQLKRGNTNAKARGISTKWFKNGEPVKLYEAQTSIKSLLSKRRSRSKTVDLLLDEQERWSNLYPVSHIYAEGKYLILPSVQWGDQGFYTCELAVKGKKWITKFYTLIVSGISYTAELPDPFYLHSNLGYRNALYRVSMWLDSAQVVWKLNGIEQSRGLASRLDRRIQLIPRLNLTHQGIWTCYLVIPSPGTQNLPWAPRSGYFLINEFRLYVSYSPFSLWKLAQFPSATRTMRNLSVGFGLLSLTLIVLFLVNAWASNQWIVRTLTSKQKKAIVQEMVDNECRLLLVARKRARSNKHRLLPLIIKEQQRLDRVNQFLMDRLQVAYLVEKAITRFPEKMNLTHLLFDAPDLGNQIGMQPSEMNVRGNYQEDQENKEGSMYRVGDSNQLIEDPRGYNMNMQESSNEFRFLNPNPNDDDGGADLITNKPYPNLWEPGIRNLSQFPLVQKPKPRTNSELVQFIRPRSDQVLDQFGNLSTCPTSMKEKGPDSVAVHLKSVASSNSDQTGHNHLDTLLLKWDSIGQIFRKVEDDDLAQEAQVSYPKQVRRKKYESLKIS